MKWFVWKKNVFYFFISFIVLMRHLLLTDKTEYLEFFRFYSNTCWFFLLVFSFSLHIYLSIKIRNGKEMRHAFYSRWISDKFNKRKVFLKDREREREIFWLTYFVFFFGSISKIKSLKLSLYCFRALSQQEIFNSKEINILDWRCSVVWVDRS